MSPEQIDAGAQTGEVFGNKFHVRRLIGEGGMGAVYEVEHVFTKRVGALKLLHKSFAAMPDVVERFIREASAAGRIGNPHIIETFDAGKLDTGEPYIFMELLVGSPVSDLIARRERLRFDESLEIAIQAAEGLAAAHATDIVHRDIKPENLFLRQGDKPFVKILDFGISKFAPRHTGDYRLTAEGTPMGTPYYMSPEQVVGRQDIDARTDVYSLGVVLYECVTGQLPFDADSLPALSVKIHEGEYIPCSELRPDAPPGFDALLASAMAVRREDRYPNAAAFREALLQIQKHAPLSFAPTIAGVPHATAAQSLSAGLARAHERAAAEASDRNQTEEPGPVGVRSSNRVYVVAAVLALGLVAALALWMRFNQTEPESELKETDRAALKSTPATEQDSRTSRAKSPTLVEDYGRLAVPPVGSAEDKDRPISNLRRAPETHKASAASPDADSTSLGRAVTEKPRPQRSPKKLPSAAVSASSRAARDGLSEENPFEE